MTTCTPLPMVCWTILAFAVAGCSVAQDTRPKELDAVAFREHFAREGRCKAAVDKIVLPAAKQFAHLSTIGEMRQWMAQHPSDGFVSFATRVQKATASAGVSDPRSSEAQMLVARNILPELERVPGIDATSCGPDVRDLVMEALYNGTGGETAKVTFELRAAGVTGSSEQRWTLMTALMVQKLAAGVF